MVKVKGLDDLIAEDNTEAGAALQQAARRLRIPIHNQAWAVRAILDCCRPDELPPLVQPPQSPPPPPSPPQLPPQRQQQGADTPVPRPAKRQRRSAAIAVMPQPPDAARAPAAPRSARILPGKAVAAAAGASAAQLARSPVASRSPLRSRGAIEHEPAAAGDDRHNRGALSAIPEVSDAPPDSEDTSGEMLTPEWPLLQSQQAAVVSPSIEQPLRGSGWQTPPAVPFELQDPADGPPPGMGLPSTHFHTYYKSLVRVTPFLLLTPYSSRLFPELQNKLYKRCLVNSRFARRALIL